MSEPKPKVKEKAKEKEKVKERARTAAKVKMAEKARKEKEKEKAKMEEKERRAKEKEKTEAKASQRNAHATTAAKQVTLPKIAGLRNATGPAPHLQAKEMEKGPEAEHQDQSKREGHHLRVNPTHKYASFTRLVNAEVPLQEQQSATTGTQDFAPTLKREIAPLIRNAYSCTPLFPRRKPNLDRNRKSTTQVEQRRTKVQSRKRRTKVLSRKTNGLK